MHVVENIESTANRQDVNAHRLAEAKHFQAFPMWFLSLHAIRRQ